MNSDLPKVLHPVCGKPIIQYVLDIARTVSSLKNYVVLGFRNDIVCRALPADAQVVIQKKLLGTADAIRSAENFLKSYTGDVLVLCGDTPLLQKETVRKVIQKHRQTKAACTFLTATIVNPQGYGRIIRDGQNRVMAIREDKDASFDEKQIHEINVGVYCFDNRTLFQLIRKVELNAIKKEFYLTDIIDLLVRNNLKVEAVQTEDEKEGLGVNSREDLAYSEGVIRKKILRQLMRDGVTITDPETTYISAGVKIGKDTTIRPFTVIEDHVVIGQRCLIGPFCRLRPGTRIADETEIGNFTEISRSSVGRNSFMKHFGFLGDARIGAKVNIGAGTVTANFDGKNKNVTTISDEAFIGSDSVLVAPVKIGKKAATGAGCVLPRGKNVPAGQVAAGVPAKIIARRKF